MAGVKGWLARGLPVQVRPAGAVFPICQGTASALDGPRASNGYLGGAIVRLIDVDGQAGMCLWLNAVDADVLVGADNVSHFSQARVRSEILCVSKECDLCGRMFARGHEGSYATEALSNRYSRIATTHARSPHYRFWL